MRKSESPAPFMDELLRHANWMKGLARSLVHDPATADDLVQETWLRTMKSPPKHDGDARGWLARVLENVWREGGRKERARADHEERAASPEALSSGTEQLERLELQRLLAAAVAELPEPHRAVLLWHYYEGLSSAEIARRQGQPADRVRQRLKRAKELLRDKLRRDHGHEWSARFAVLAPVAGKLTPRGTVGAASVGVAASWAPTLFVLGTLGVVAVALTLVLNGTFDPRAPVEEHASVADDEPSEAATERDVAPKQQARATRLSRSALLAPGAPRALGLQDAVTTPTHGAVYGTVVAAESASPLANVCLVLTPNSSSRGDAIELFSDSTGAFRFDGLEAKRYVLVARLRGRVPQVSDRFRVEEGAEVAMHIELEAGFEVAVDVTCEGVPVPNATVLLAAGDRKSIMSTSRDDVELRSVTDTTNTSGRANVAGLARGVYQVIVSAAGYANYRGEAAPRPASDAVQVELARGATLRGHVWLPNGEPAVGAHVFLNTTAILQRAASFYYAENGAPVDANGAYSIADLPAASYHAVALLPDGSGTFHMQAGTNGASELATIEIQAGEEARLDLNLPEPARLHGQVLNPLGEPVPDVRVSVSWGDFMTPDAGFFQLSYVPGTKDSIHHTTTTDADGRFAITTLRASYEPLSFSFRAEGHVGASFELACPPGTRIDRLIEMTPLGATISGRLLDQIGEPVEGVTVGAWEWEGDTRGSLFLADSDALGHYELKLPARASTFEVYPILRAHDVYSSQPERRKDLATGVVDANFELHARSVLEGSVLDVHGAAVRDFEVHLEKLGSQRPRLYRNANRGNGRYRLSVNPTQPVVAIFSARGFVPTRLTSAELGSMTEVRLVDAPDLGGRIVDAAGQPVAGALLCIATLDSKVLPIGSEHTPRAQSDEDGRFLLEGVPDGTTGNLLVVPRREDAPPLVHYSLEKLSGNDVLLRLPSVLRLEAEFVDSQGAPADGTVVVVDSDGWPLDPRLEAGLVTIDSVRTSKLGALVNGRVTFHLEAGQYWLVLVRGEEDQQAFELNLSSQVTRTFRVEN